MATRTGDRGTIGASLLFLMLCIGLAVVVHVGFTEPALARLSERRALREELERRCLESEARRDRLIIEDRAFADDPQTQERYLRSLGYGREGEVKLLAEDGR